MSSVESNAITAQTSIPDVEELAIPDPGLKAGVLTQSSADAYKAWFPWRHPRSAQSGRGRLKKRLTDALTHGDTLEKDPNKAYARAMATIDTLIADCDLRAYDSRRASKRWGGAYYLLGVPAAVLATVAGATGLASTAGRIPAAIVALVSAGLTTAVSFLNSNQNKEQSTKFSAAWQTLADDARTTVLSKSREEYLGDVINDISAYNKRKGALLRGDLPTAADAAQMQPRQYSANPG